MRYPCLVLDHDDTVVDSTASIHYPAFRAYMEKKRPGQFYTLEAYFQKNFDPGFMRFYVEELGFSKAELEEEFQFWQEFVKTRVPQAYPGMRELLARHRRAGGVLAVVTHSLCETVLRDYRENSLPKPDVVFGCELPPQQCKPYPWPLHKLMEAYGFSAAQLLVVDDLKPGYDMARAAGVAFAAAGWANTVGQISDFMRCNCDFYFQNVAELAAFLEKENGYPD